MPPAHSEDPAERQTIASDSNSIQSSRNWKTSWHHDDSHKRKRETEAKKRKWRGSRIHTHQQISNYLAMLLISSLNPPLSPSMDSPPFSSFLSSGSSLEEFYKDKTAHYLAEVWKEYSKGDSRYAARDAATVTVEGVTAVVEGPASLLAVYAIASGKSYIYILQLAVSLGQLYGTAVYFLTAYLEGDHFAATSYHYYVYYIGANASWVVIPSLIAIRCWNKICSAVQIQGQKRTKSH